MPLPLAVAAIPYIGSGLMALKGLFGGGGDDPKDAARDQAQGLQELLRALPQLRQMMDLQVSQAQRQDPLRQALTQMSMNLLPRSAFEAMQGREIPGGPRAFPQQQGRQPSVNAQFTGTRAVPRQDRY